MAYESIYKILWQTVYNLEEEQILNGVGMTVSGKRTSKEDEIEVLKDIGLKIDSTKDWNKSTAND
jgi:hypothetical protein